MTQNRHEITVSKARIAEPVQVNPVNPTNKTNEYGKSTAVLDYQLVQLQGC